ncbi:MAG: prenyltransferase/squalene oxidase repeat-containing protein [Candidatus Thorarchaeota archaeon]
MTWIPLLLADSSTSLRLLVLRNLLKRPEDDPEVIELTLIRDEDPLVKSLLSLQKERGSWKQLDHAGHTIGGSIRATSAAMMRLGYLGFTKEDSAVSKAAEFLFSKQRKDGSWPLPERVTDTYGGKGPYTISPIQTSVPLLGLAMCGYSDDPRSEQAYEWLMQHRLDDGAWPAGMVNDVFVRIAGYRRLPHSKWGCRTNTTQSIMCLAFHPIRSKSDAARDALNLLLGRETRERLHLGFNVARYIGYEPHRGGLTYHARFDPGLVLSLCSKIGANRNDDRVDDLVTWIENQQGAYGLWEYTSQPAASKWVSYDILNSLGNVDSSTQWISSKPRKHFAPYPRRKRRF